ncbi:MAG: ABC transporter permease subunit [Faecalibacterium sp.]
MYGIQIAFRDYTVRDGITGSTWVGLYHFKTFVESTRFWQLIGNTLKLSVLSLATFPIPIIFALMLNYCNMKWFRKTMQMVTYAPHFISVVVLVGMIDLFFSPSVGIVNVIIQNFGGSSIYFTQIPAYFKYLFVGSDVWQNLGWSAIIYIGTLTTVSPEIHEAAIIDGANKVQRIWNIDLPAIAPTIITMFVMRLGQLMNLSFQKVLLMQNSANITESEIISTYVYNVGLMMGNFSYATAIDLFNTLINIVLLITANQCAKKLTGTSLF